MENDDSKKEVNASLVFPNEYYEELSSITKKQNKTIVCLLVIIAVALVAIAIPALYNFKLTLKAREGATVVKSTSEENIEQAKNTLYNNGIVSLMISNFQKNTEWSFFISNTGHYVVNADGDIPNPEKFLSIVKDSSRISYRDRVSELDNLSSSSVKSMSFHIQFWKNFGEVYDTEFNHYSCNYSEITVKTNDGQTKTIKMGTVSIFEYLDAYLQDPSNLK